ncbi:MAG: YeiH family protein [Bilophila wadsworthia]
MQSEKAIGNGYHLQLMNGVLFVILFASAAYQLAWHYISLLGISPLIVGIVLGMIYGNTLRLHLPVYWLPGILFSSKVLLRVAIVLYGFRLTFQDLLLVGFNGLAISSIMLTSTFIGGTWLGIKVFGLPRRLALLTAAGSSVCGAATVLATEPVVKGNPGSSIAVGGRRFHHRHVRLSPCTAGFLDMSEKHGMFVGGTLHEVAHRRSRRQAISIDAAALPSSSRCSA